MRRHFTAARVALVFLVAACRSPTEPKTWPLTGTWKYDATVVDVANDDYTMVLDGHLTLEQREDTLFGGTITATCTRFYGDRQMSADTVDRATLWSGSIHGADVSFVFYRVFLVATWTQEGTVNGNVIEGNASYFATDFWHTVEYAGPFRATRGP